MTDPAAIAAALAATEARLGPPETLVNNAGISGPNFPLDAYPPDEWRRVINVNLIGVFNCCRAIVPPMRRRDYGRIVNISSIAGKEGNPNASAYLPPRPASSALPNRSARNWPRPASGSIA